MTTKHALKSVLDLDLDPIKVKLMHKQSGEGWELAKANAVEVEYKRFLHLSKEFPNEMIAPTSDVDTFWHYHILDTMKYAADCAAAFGYFLHHFPYVGLRGEDDEAEQVRNAERMAELYESAFGEPYLAKAAYCTRAQQAAAASEAAYCTRAQQANKANAYCTRAAHRDAAYCTRALQADAAYCTRAPQAAAAYCTRAQQTTADAAYCTRTPAQLQATPTAQAYCSRAPQTTGAYCTRPPAAVPSYCTRGQQASYCTRAVATESFKATRPELAAA